MMRFHQVTLLLLAIVSLSTLVQACGDCTPAEREAERLEREAAAATPPPHDKKKKEKAESTVMAVAPAPKSKDKSKEKTKAESTVMAVAPAPKSKDKSKEKTKAEKTVMAVAPAPKSKDKSKEKTKEGSTVKAVAPKSKTKDKTKAPAPGGSNVMAGGPKPGSGVMAVSPSPTMVPSPKPGSGVMAVSPSPTMVPSPTGGSSVQAQNPLAVDVRVTPEGTVIEQCLNNFGAFKARSEGPPAIIVDCICCQNADIISDTNFPDSCGQITDFPFVVAPFDFCATCQDVLGCDKCWEFDPNSADGSCKIADTGTGPGQVLPTTQTLLVNDIGGGPAVSSMLKTCPPPSQPCTIVLGDQTFELSDAGVIPV